MFVKITNGEVDQYPYTVGDLRRDNPTVSFPKTISQTTMADYGMHPVGYQAAPEYNPLTHRIQHSSQPALVDGEWTLTKEVVALTTEQIETNTAATAKAARTKRDSLIAATDYFALTDVTMNADMTTYRQALRDITSHANWPNLNKDDWPTKP